jgi:hypothetical protein
LSLYLFHEGTVTEKLVYRAWIQHALPGLREVESAPEITRGTFFLFAGGGFPAYEPALENCACDVRDNPAIEHLLVCVDTDDRPSAGVRRALVEARVEQAIAAVGMRAGNPDVQVHVVVQHWCIETWFLGHATLSLRAPPTPRLQRLMAHFDVRAADPETMGLPPWTDRDTARTTHGFHQQYLAELFQNVVPRTRYAKNNPGIVLDRAYYDALVERVDTTSHLPSLAHLFETLRRVAAPPHAGETTDG